MTNTENTFDFSSTIKGYYYHPSIWSPQKSEALECYYEFGHAFYMFVIKTSQTTRNLKGD